MATLLARRIDNELCAISGALLPRDNMVPSTNVIVIIAQAVGMVNDHLITCEHHAICKDLGSHPIAGALCALDSFQAVIAVRNIHKAAGCTAIRHEAALLSLMLSPTQSPISSLSTPAEVRTPAQPLLILALPKMPCEHRTARRS